MILAFSLENQQAEIDYVECLKFFPCDFLLVWDWGNSPELQELGEYKTLVWTDDRMLERSKTDEGGNLKRVARIWNVLLILDDIDEYKEAIAACETASGQNHVHVRGNQLGRTLLSWVAEYGHDLVNVLLKEDNINPSLKDNRSGLTPLSWAAKSGHEAIVKLLLETGKVEVDLKNKDNQTPLSQAAKNGRKDIVKLLLETGRVEVNSKNKDGQTALSWAAEKGHNIINLLLKTSKVDVNSRDRDGRTPLELANNSRNEDIVKLLDEHGGQP